MEDNRVMMFDNTVLRRIFEPKREVTGNGEKYRTRNFIICKVLQILGY
jgi:hypothetical protein